ncbi:MAG: hypothetical protein ACRDQZ_01480, partial [Mycobacteriales bacterium]
CRAVVCPPGQIPFARLDRPNGSSDATGGRVYCAAPPQADVAGRALVEFRQYKPKVPVPTIEPGEWALTNYPSVFSSAVAARDVVVTVVGRRLVLHVRPTNFHWDFGDGATLNTTKPGNRYDADKIDTVEQLEKFCDVTHRYTATGAVHGSLTVTFDATYSFDGGPPHDIPGSITATSPAFTLDVKQARGQHVSGE